MQHYSIKYRIINFLVNRDFLSAFNFVVNLRGKKVIKKIPIVKGLGKDLLVESEPWMLEVLYNLKDQLINKTFIDVGVNVGQTLIRIKELFPKVDYLGFEPNPYCVNYALNLIALNKLENTTILPVGLSSTRNHFKLLLDNNSLTDSSASIINTYRKGKHHKLDIVTLMPKDIITLHRLSIGVIKIDVEGAELEVLEGLKDLILKNKPKIIIEILPVYTEKNTDRNRRQIEIENIIEEINYSIYRINEKNGVLSEINSIGVHSDLSKCNYLLAPRN